MKGAKQTKSALIQLDTKSLQGLNDLADGGHLYVDDVAPD